MRIFDHLHSSAATRRQRFGLNHDAVSMTHDLMPLLDLAGLLLAAVFSTWACTHWLAVPGSTPDPGRHLAAITVVLAAVAPPLLHDPRVGNFADSGTLSALLRIHALRLTLLTGLILALGTLGGALNEFTRLWLTLWFVASMLLTSLTRALWVRYVRRLRDDGRLGEVVAIVGSGPAADRLAQALGKAAPRAAELLGVFDDEAATTPGGTKLAGSVAELLELGKTRRIDWILLALPGDAEPRIPALLQRLKALSAPVGVCLPHMEAGLPYCGTEFISGVPVSLLTERRAGTRRGSAAAPAQILIPRWLITLALLPFRALSILAERGAGSHARPEALTLSFDDHDVGSFTCVAARFGQERFGYVVTPNVDHVIRLHDSAMFRRLYAQATYTLLDSRFLSHLLRLTRRATFPVCTGSDLTASLFANVIHPDDPLVLIGATAEQARRLTQRHGLKNLAHFNPPMGFIKDEAAIRNCLQFIEAHSPFRFCLLAVGSPQQELLAWRLKDRGVARGLALCVGASLDFLTGNEARAPGWMQRSGMEWIYRLAQAPARMGRRYLLRGPRIFGLLRMDNFRLRPASATSPPQALSATTWSPGDPDRRTRTGRRPILFQRESGPGHSNG